MTELHPTVLSSQEQTLCTSKLCIECWEGSWKSVKIAIHHLYKSSDAYRLAVHTLSFSSIYPISKLNIDVHHALLSSLSFLSKHSFPFFMTRRHMLLSVFFMAGDTVRSFSNVPCPNYRVWYNVFLGKEVGVWRKSFALTSSSSGSL